jgi:hypothetical protein
MDDIREQAGGDADGAEGRRIVRDRDTDPRYRPLGGFVP